MRFSKAIDQYFPEDKVISKPTDAERKCKQRQIMRKCTKHIENQIGEREALNYKRMRISQSFETPEAKRHRYETNAFTKFCQCHGEKLQFQLESWPETETINWSKVAREHGITARNGGQIVKEFAAENGFDTTKLDKRTGIKRMRARKLKMPGGEIAVPCHKTMDRIKLDLETIR